MVNDNLDKAVGSLAQRQHGAFSRGQAFQLGASYAIIRRRLLKGVWIQSSGSTYILNGTPDTWERRVHVAVLDRPEGVLSGSTSAVLHGIPGYRRMKPEITVPFSANGRAGPFIVRRCRHFGEISSMYVSGFPTMSVEETVFDLARRLSGMRLQSTIEDIVVKRLSSFAGLEATLRRRIESGCPSATPVVRVLSDLNGSASESELERAFFRIARLAGLPTMKQQAPAPWWDTGPLRVDITVPIWHLIIELDGRSWHTRQDDFERDRSRDNRAVAAGWRVLRFTSRMITHQPDVVIDTIRSAGSVAV